MKRIIVLQDKNSEDMEVLNEIASKIDTLIEKYDDSYLITAEHFIIDD